MIFFKINGMFHFSTEDSESNIVKGPNGEHKLGDIETVEVFTNESRVLVLTRDSKKNGLPVWI